MWEDNVRRVIPYTPGEQPRVSNLIKLNTNENPYPPAPGVERALKEMDPAMLRKYPDPTCDLLVSAISDTYGVEKEKIFVGVGSDDVLAMAFLTFFNGDKEILFPDVTYSFYDVWAELYRIPYRQIPLKEDFSLEPEDYLVPNGGAVIANPNAPTGLAQPIDAIEKIISGNPDSVVIVDEAYVDFGAESALPLIDKYDNLLVVQTFSKSRSMAGMRIGIAFGQPELIKYLSDVKYSFNSYTLNMPALILGAEAVRDTAYFTQTRDRVIATREWTKEELRKLDFEFADSKTNFIFARHKTVERDVIFNGLRQRNILVRAFNGPRTKDHLRISIGTDEEMQTVIKALKEILGK